MGKIRVFGQLKNEDQIQKFDHPGILEDQTRLLFQNKKEKVLYELNIKEKEFHKKDAVSELVLRFKNQKLFGSYRLKAEDIEVTLSGTTIVYKEEKNKITIIYQVGEESTTPITLELSWKEEER